MPMIELPQPDNCSGHSRPVACFQSTSSRYAGRLTREAVSTEDRVVCCSTD